jgi:predicted lipoprotein
MKSFRSLALVCFMLCTAIAIRAYAADITITIVVDDSAGKASGTITDFVVAHGWTATIPDPANPGMTISNPETRAQAAKRIIQKFITDSGRAVRVSVKREAEAKKESDLVDTEVKFK